jgi:hypothetical protein
MSTPNHPTDDGGDTTADPTDGAATAAPPETAADPVKVCPGCSVQTQTSGAFCPHCGRAYSTRPRRWHRPGKKVLAAGLAVLLLAGGGTALGVHRQHVHELQVKRAAAAAAHAKAHQAQLAAQERAAAKRAADTLKRAERADDVQQLESAILTSARKAAKQAYTLAPGPILRVQCTALGGGSNDDLTALTGTFTCIAVHKRNADGTESGYSYTGTIDYNTGMMQWQLG